jgi:hypothetical protein
MREAADLASLNADVGLRCQTAGEIARAAEISPAEISPAEIVPASPTDKD